MCIAIPAKVLSIKGKSALVEFGGGTQREINTALTVVNVGQYVIVHAGFAIQVMDEAEAMETLALFDELARFQEDEEARFREDEEARFREDEEARFREDEEAHESG